jgi:hypothetical protein
MLRVGSVVALAPVWQDHTRTTASTLERLGRL